MSRLAWWQARFRPTRTLALVAGVLVAAAAFTVLTAASRTEQARTVGTVSANFSPAYDILVRPKGARSVVESATRTVQPDFQSGIYGGITMAQYRRIQGIPGVQIAAPIAMVGYAQLTATRFVTVPERALAGPGRQLFRISTTYVNDNGSSRVTQPPGYLYVTPLRLKGNPTVGARTATDGTGRGCTHTGNAPVSRRTDPFSAAAQSYAKCWSRINHYNYGSAAEGLGPSGSKAGYWVSWTIPVLIAAIDPNAEARLDGLNGSLVSGRYLKEHEGDKGPTFPVLASSQSGMNEYARTTLQRLATPAAMPNMNVRWEISEASAPGATVARLRSTAQRAYHLSVSGHGPILTFRGLSGTFTGISFNGYWSVGQVHYRRASGGVLVPRRVSNPASLWYTGTVDSAAMDDEDSQYRTVTAHAKVHAENHPSGPLVPPLIKITGVFDPARIRSFSPLSEVPLGDYQPVVVRPATAASRRALRGGDLLPSQNVGGLVSQPVNLVTSLSALPVLQNTRYFRRVHAAHPISVIRVRVAGVTGPGALSRERINAVAQQIAQRTGLEVDVVAGSSPAAQRIDLPADKFGQPPLTLSENWVHEGVALAIVHAIDKTSVVLFILILVVCVLFVANAATAAVRGRRRELGVLAAVGWRRSRLFGTVLGELAGIGLVAGLLAAALALPVSAALNLDVSLGRALLAVPVAMVVAVIGGVTPAWLAARADPVSSVRPPVLPVRRAHQPRGITSLAALNVARTPGRALIGVAGLAVGIAALTMLIAVTLAYHGQIVGSLLGNYIAVQVRSVDYIAAGATVALGVLAVVDVVFLNITERAAELATIRSFGWRDTTLARLVMTEGAIIGTVGSLAGAGLGLAAAARFAGRFPAELPAVAAGAAAAGIIVTSAATLLPAALLRRLPTTQLLAEE